MFSSSDTEAEGGNPSPADLRAKCEAIAAMVLPPPPPPPAPAPAVVEGVAPAAASDAAAAPAPAAAAPADGAAMAVEVGEEAPAEAATPAEVDPNAPALLSDAAVRAILEAAAPIDGALFRMSREATVIPRSSFLPAARAIFDDNYRLYDSDAVRCSPGLLLASEPEVATFLRSLTSALDEPGTAILVKGDGDLPVLANSCAHYGISWDYKSVLPRVVDVGSDSAFRFWRGVMGNGQLGANAYAALKLCRDVTAAAAAAAAAVSPVVEAPAPAPVPAATLTPTPTPDAAAAGNGGAKPRAFVPREEKAHLACCSANPRVAAIAPEVLALEAALTAAAATVANPQLPAPAGASASDVTEPTSAPAVVPLTAYSGGLFEPQRPHNPLTDSYLTVVVAAVQDAAREEITQVAARETGRNASYKLKAVEDRLAALKALLAPPPPPAQQTEASEGGEAAAASAPAAPAPQLLPPPLDPRVASALYSLESAATELRKATNAAAAAREAAEVFVGWNSDKPDARPAGWQRDRLAACGAIPATAASPAGGSEEGGPRKRARLDESAAASSSSSSAQ